MKEELSKDMEKPQKKKTESNGNPGNKKNPKSN
jgi:hypothetical protein